MDNEILLAANNVSVGYGKKCIVENLNFIIHPGELIALVGKNGVGKSTLLRTLTTDLKPMDGKIMLNGKALNDYNRRTLATMLSVVTTEPLQVGALTVKELVGLGRDPHTGLTGRLTESDKEIVTRAMQSVGISYKENEFMANLSDGERQKALIARALAQETPLIILDEPFSFLDVSARIEILAMLKELCEKEKRTVIYSSHDISQALRMADIIWMLTPSRKLITGSPNELIETKQIDKLFDIKGVRFDASQNDFVASNLYKI